jgi:hypothetical protein
VVNAEASLRSLKQTSSAAAYATEFRRLKMLLSWNDAALCSQYLVNLKDSVQDELARRDKIEKLDTLIATSIDIDNRLYHRLRQKRQSVNMNPSRGHPKPVSVTPKSSQGQHHGPQPMEVDPAPAKVHTLSDAQRQYRKENGLCMYCGIKGHFANQCPKNSKAMASTLSTKSLPSKESVTSHTVAHVNMLQASITNNSLYLKIGLEFGGQHHEIDALIDSGATVSFIHPRLAQ